MGMRSIKGGVAGLALAGAVLAGCGNSTGDGGDSGGSAAAPAPSATTSAAPASNGVAELEPDAILTKAKAALREAGSYRLKGTVVQDKQPMKMDFKVDGKNLAGEMSFDKATVELLAVGGKQYIRPDEAFWTMTAGDAKQGKALAKLIGDRWVIVPKDEKDLGSLFAPANVEELLEPDGKVSKGDAKDVAGTPAIGLVTSGSDGGTMYVATTGEPYPLRIESDKASEGAIDFSDFGEKFAGMETPPANEVLDLKDLQN
ncbi:hypothetical protein [Symbioplanes lichenis]|uniref:hypothetical protein n=1 Tax=Symbioplanes lichenis TaxID=1629072 RepID=UPI002738744B|nr:hypothetical protein [Actinoplanes lichenis]